jgi:hypothetical protein
MLGFVHRILRPALFLMGMGGLLLWLLRNREEEFFTQITPCVNLESRSRLPMAWLAADDDG